MSTVQRAVGMTGVAENAYVWTAQSGWTSSACWIGGHSKCSLEWAGGRCDCPCHAVSAPGGEEPNP